MLRLEACNRPFSRNEVQVGKASGFGPSNPQKLLAAISKCPVSVFCLHYLMKPTMGPVGRTASGDHVPGTRIVPPFLSPQSRGAQ